MSATIVPADERPPSADWIRGGKPVWAALGLLALALLFSYSTVLAGLAKRWSNEPDYSHGFLVPVFSAALLWLRRGLLTGVRLEGSWWGLAFLAVAGAMRWCSAYYFYPLLDAASLLPCLAGLAVLVGGWNVWRWSWPAIAYLAFMIPIPATIAGWLSQPLQAVATTCSTWWLQTLGLPAVARGNVIWLTHDKIGVVEACSGLRMLMLFLAITVGAAFLIQRPLWEKVFVALSALVIGVIANILRITVTAFLYEYVGAELAEKVFHDLAGWLMMPIATILLMLELSLLSKLLIAPTQSEPVVLHR